MTELAPRPTPGPVREGGAPGASRATAGAGAGAAAAVPPPLPRTDPVTHLPILILYPHSRCNCRCVMCDIWRREGREEIDPAAVEAWLPELLELGVERVVLSGGEALMHSRLWELCRPLTGAGIGITLVTTGLLLRRDAQRLVAHVDDVVVSLDGPPDVHDAIRRIPTAWKKLVEGVRAVREADPAGRVRIGGRCTVQRANHRHLRATVDAAREAGLDSISFLAADVSSEAFNRPGGWGPERASEVALDAGELAALEVELEALERDHAADFASGFIQEPPAKLEARILRHFAALLGRGDFAPVACNAPWISSVVEADGTVRPCFFQPPLGNVHEAGGLAAVLNAPEAVAWRRGLDTARDEVCRRCVCSLELREGGRGPRPGAVPGATPGAAP